MKYKSNFRKTFFSLVITMLMGFSLHSQEKFWDENDGSITVENTERTFTTFVAETEEDVKKMVHFNFAAPFTLDPDYTPDGIIGDLYQNGLIYVYMYAYDQTKPDGKGPLVYGTRHANLQNGNPAPTSFDVVYDHGLWGSNLYTSSEDIKRLTHQVEIFKTADKDYCSFDLLLGQGNVSAKNRVEGVALMAAGILIDAVAGFSIGITLISIPITGGSSTSLLTTEIGGLLFGTGLIDSGYWKFNEPELTPSQQLLQEECREFFSPYQPVIVEVTVRNAKFKSLRFPGNVSLSSRLTPRQLFEYETPKDRLNQVIVNNYIDYATFNNETNGVTDVAELTVNGDVLICDFPELTDKTKALVATESHQLYVGSMQIGLRKDENGEPIKANGSLSDDFLIESSNKFLLADYVFEPEYKARDLEEMEVYIKTHKHLPDIPSQKETEKNGYYSVPNMIMGQLKNTEELYLHKFNLNAKINALKSDQETLIKRLEALKESIENIKKNK